MSRPPDPRHLRRGRPWARDGCRRPGPSRPTRSAGGDAAALALVLVAGLGAWTAGAAQRGARPRRLARSPPPGRRCSWPRGRCREPAAPSPFTAALALGATAPSTGRRRPRSRTRARRRSVGALAARGAGVDGDLAGRAARPLTFDPAATGCFACPRNLLLVARRRRHCTTRSCSSGLYRGRACLRRRVAARRWAGAGARPLRSPRCLGGGRGVAPSVPSDGVRRRVDADDARALARPVRGARARRRRRSRSSCARARRLSRRIADIVVAACRCRSLRGAARRVRRSGPRDRLSRSAWRRRRRRRPPDAARRRPGAS